MFKVNVIDNTSKDDLVKKIETLENEYIKDSTLKTYRKVYSNKTTSRQQNVDNVCIIPWNKLPLQKNQDQKQMHDLEDKLPIITKERRLYSYENLNEKQSIIFNCVINENRHGITLVQAGPGTGKTNIYNVDNRTSFGYT